MYSDSVHTRAHMALVKRLLVARVCCQATDCCQFGVPLYPCTILYFCFYIVGPRITNAEWQFSQLYKYLHFLKLLSGFPFFTPINCNSCLNWASYSKYWLGYRQSNELKMNTKPCQKDRYLVVLQWKSKLLSRSTNFSSKCLHLGGSLQLYTFSPIKKLMCKLA